MSKLSRILYLRSTHKGILSSVSDLHFRSIHVSQRLFSSSSGDGDDLKEPETEAQSKSKAKASAAKVKLNDLLKSIVQDSTKKEASESSKQKQEVEFKLAAPIKEKKVIKKKPESEDGQPPEPKLSPELLTAVKSVASTLGGDPTVIETELVQKLKTQSADKINLSELFLGMKIDRTKKVTDPPKSELDEGSRAQRVRRILDDQRRDGGFQRGDRFDFRDDRHRSVSGSLMPRERRGPPSEYARIELFGAKPLGFFKKDPKTPPPQTPVLQIWDAVHAKELKLTVTHPPANGFEEMILWTNQGKFWQFPINNEQGLEEEASVPFYEHVFLEPKIENWCPKQGPVRRFMELVCVALSKNPHLTVVEKEEYLEWYHEYFKGKSNILKEVGAGEVH